MSETKEAMEARLASLEVMMSRIANKVGVFHEDVLTIPPEPDAGTGWVIEGYWKSGTHYWGLDNKGHSLWTPDHNAAIRFAARSDAERMINHFQANRVAGTLIAVFKQLDVRAG